MGKAAAHGLIPQLAHGHARRAALLLSDPPTIAPELPPNPVTPERPVYPPGESPPHPVESPPLENPVPVREPPEVKPPMGALELLAEMHLLSVTRRAAAA